jgi:hypothetical protein
MPITEVSQLDVSFRGTEANNIFLEPVFFDDDLRGQFRILGNVANKKKMVFVQQLENIVRKYSGCGFNPIGSVDIYDRTIDVEKMKVDLEMCWDEFEDTVFEELLKTGTRLPDVSGTLIENILIDPYTAGDSSRRSTFKLLRSAVFQQSKLRCFRRSLDSLLSTVGYRCLSATDKHGFRF